MKNKTIQISVNEQRNDLARKAKQLFQFYTKGLGTRVELRLRNGREAGRTDDADAQMDLFLSMVELPEKKVGERRWANTTLSVFVHPGTSA
jgi:translation initiation factor IF-3